MARSHRCLAVMIALILTFATPALAEPGDPVVEFGDGGTVEIPPRRDENVAPGELVVRPDGSAVIDISHGDVDYGFSAVVVDPFGFWRWLPMSGTCSSERAGLVDDGSVVFAGDCENGSFAIRFTADLTLDPAWGSVERPGVFWHDELGRSTVLGIDGDTVLYLTGPWDDPKFVGRSSNGALVGTMPIDTSRMPVAVFPSVDDGYLLPGFLDGVGFGVVAGNLGGTTALVNVIPLAGGVDGMDTVVGRDGSLLGAYTAMNDLGQRRLHLYKIDRNGRQDSGVTDPSLVIPIDLCWCELAIAELRTGEIVVGVSSGRGHTQIDKFTASGHHVRQLVGPDRFPPTFGLGLDLGVSSIDGDVLVSASVRDPVRFFDYSVAQILRFEGDTSGRFVDDDSSVFAGDIEWLAASSITKGCNPPASDWFCPSANVTRGQTAAFLVRALNLTDRLEDPFTDDDGSVFETDIEKLAAAGITKGCNPPENDRFCPDEKISRGQMAAFLVRALNYTDNGGGDLFTDDDVSMFEGDIDRLGTAGVTKGCNPVEGNTKFCPTGYVTRGQMAAFLHRALG